jgi:uncharacterized protein YjiS (DUF1127 family)
MTRRFCGREEAEDPITATWHPPRSISSARFTARGWLLSNLTEGRAVLETWRRRYRYRRELERLMGSGPHLIEDIGLPQTHANREVAQPFWRP